MSEQTFELKGNLFTLSVLKLISADLAKIQIELENKIAQAPNFFVGAPIVINLINIQNKKIDLLELKILLEKLKLNPIGICNPTDDQISTAKSIGLSVINHSEDQHQPNLNNSESEPVIEVYNPPEVIHSNVRSGQQIYAKNCDLIVLGSIGYGAEVIADGNIHIYGTLRGRAIAGAQGYAEATIYCQKLEAELVSINGNYWISDSLQGQFWGKPSQIKHKNDSLEISALNKG